MSGNLKKNAFASYTNLLISIVAGFIAVPIIEGHIGKSYFGIYQFVFSLAAYSQLMSMGLSKTVERYIAEYSVQKKSDQENLMVSMVLSIYIITFVIFVFGASILYMNFGKIFNFTDTELKAARICFMIAAVNGGLNIPASVFQSYLRGRGRYAFVFNIGTIQAVARIVFVAVFLNMGYGIVTVFIIDFVMFQLANILFAVYSVSKYKIKLDLFRFERTFLLKILKFTSYVFLAGIADALYWSTDNIILGIYTSAAVIAEYALSQRLVNYFYRYGTAFSGLFLPRFMEYHCIEDKEESRLKMIELFTSASRQQGIMVSFAMVNFIILGKHFINLWVGPNYSLTYSYTIIIMIPYWLVLTQFTGVEVLYVMEKHKVNTLIFLANAIINIISTVILVRMIGPFGAAISTSVTMFIGSFLLSNIYYKHILNMNLTRYFNRVFTKNFIISFVFLLYGYIINYFLPLSGMGSFML